MITLYRILREPVPVRADFRSHMSKCDPRRGAELVDHALWAGVSMFIDPLAAARRARRYHLGTHLARLEVPEDDPAMVVRPTLADNHYTVWACEDQLFGHVVEITAIPLT
jgi:hypothetical protein